MTSAIDSYQFGQITIGGREYTEDIIIFPDRVKDGWRRKSSHRLCLEDIAEVIAQNPQTLVVGTGASGLMEVLDEVRRAADDGGIDLIAETTDQACRTYNRLRRSRRVAAVLHLTC